MNKPEELTGALVLVHPGLGFDPSGKQNQFGIITDADLEKDDIYVAFAKGEQGLYPADALLMLKPSDAISREALKHALDLDTADFKALIQISLLQNRKSSMSNTREAMVQAMQNDTIRQYSMVSLAEMFPQERVAGIER